MKYATIELISLTIKIFTDISMFFSAVHIHIGIMLMTPQDTVFLDTTVRSVVHPFRPLRVETIHSLIYTLCVYV